MDDLGPDPTARQLLVALWDASTAKPPSRGAAHSQGLARGNLEKFARWSVDQFGADEVLAIMHWSERDLDRLCSTGFDGSTARRRSGPPRKRGKASESQRGWNGEWNRWFAGRPVESEGP